MKKYAVLFLMIMFVITGCEKRHETGAITEEKEEYTYTAEVFPNSEMEVLKSKGEEIVVEFNGKEYSYIKKKTYMAYMLDKVIGSYKGKDKGSLEIDENTGDILMIFTDEYALSSNNPVKSLTIAEAREYANEFAEKYIKLDEYQVECDIGDMYQFTYTRYINDLKSTDEVSVYISESGNVVAFCNSNMQDIGNLSYEGFDKEKAYATAKDAMIKRFPECYPESVVLEDEIFTMKDGKPAILYYAYIYENKKEDCKEGEGEKYYDYKLASIIVTWDE